MCPGSEIAVWLSKLYELGRFGLLREIMTVLLFLILECPVFFLWDNQPALDFEKMVKEIMKHYFNVFYVMILDFKLWK